MAIKELTAEQVRTMTLAEKDRWWREEVFKGDLPQLTIRAALTGMLLGGILSLTNLYVGIRTGWTLGVGITSVIITYAAFKVMATIGIGREMTVLENNAMQSIATSAGYMTAPLISSLPAYMLVTGQVVPPLQTGIWIVLVAVLGVLFAFPLKKRFINDEQLPFPEGYAAGVVMDSLHTERGREGMFKAKLLVVGGMLSAIIEVMRSERVMRAIHLKWATLPDAWDDLIYRFVTPRLLGTPLRDLTVRFDTSILMMGTGGLMGVRTATSLLIGAAINYLVLAPIMLSNGIIHVADLQGDHLLVALGRGGDDDDVVAVGVPEQAEDHPAVVHRNVWPGARQGRRRPAGRHRAADEGVRHRHPDRRRRGDRRRPLHLRRARGARAAGDPAGLRLHAHRRELDRPDVDHPGRRDRQDDPADLQRGGAAATPRPTS